MINREVVYERNMTGSYMKIPEGVNPGLDERLMLRGKLKGTLPVEKTYIDGCGQYWYNISGKQSLDTYCRMKEIGIEFVERLVVSVCSELEILEWNLIQTGCLMLDPELVFITNSNREFIFTLYPGGSTEIGMEFQQLMEYLLTKIDHKDEAAVRAAYGIYERTLEEGYSVMDIRDSILRAKEVEEPVTEERPIEKAFVERRTEAVYSSQAFPEADAGIQRLKTHRPEAEENTRKPRSRRSEMTGERKRNGEKKRVGLARKLGNFLKVQLGYGDKAEEKGEFGLVYPEEEIETFQEEIHPTICLSSFHGAPRGVLLYQGAESLSDIPLETKIVKIGHGREADARIDRDTVSQLHARIDRDGDNFYIEDLNSTNGTCVNDEALVYKERRQLKVNDIVQFADVRYRFC